MNVNEVYQIILYAAGKNLEQGYVSPDDFNNILMPQAQAEYLDYLLGEYQKYQPGRKIAVVEMSNKEKIRQSFSPLIYETILPVNSSTGISSYPSDYAMTDAMWSVYGYYNIRFVSQPRLASFVHSTIDPIQDNPVYLLRHEGFQFFPPTIGSARMTYVRNPPSIFWAYTMTSSGPVYDPINSQQPVWADFDLNNIIARALRIIGVNLDSQVVSQYANEIKTVGQ